MTDKTKKIISIVLKSLVSLMLVMSAIMKISMAPEIVAAMSKTGYANLILPLGIGELLCVILFWIPQTSRIGFLLVTSYLGGAAAVEIAGGKPPMAFVFIAVIWISEFLKNRSTFISTDKKLI